MNPQTLLACLPWAGEDLLLSGGAVLLAGIALVHFWKEILVGFITFVLILHYLCVKEELVDKSSRKLQARQMDVDNSIYANGLTKSEYLEECYSLTQSRSMCTEVVEQFMASEP